MGEVNLNSEDAIKNSAGGTPFFPFRDFQVAWTLVNFVFRKGDNGRAYIAEVRVDVSDTDEVKEGRTYALYFPLDVSAKRKNIELGKLRAFCAGCFGEDSKDPEFDANAAIDVLTENGKEEGALEKLGIRVEHNRYPRESKEAKNEDGTPKVYHQDRYELIG